jgi:pimeloyl-ACP methyl ester carboxylesterase
MRQIGLWPYVPFLEDIKKADPNIGILALEILPISMRITGPMSSAEKIVEELKQILSLHDISEFVLVSHSFGSVLTTHILRSSLAPRVASIILIDPVTLLLHLGDVAYNFVYRQPDTANQWQLWYFASRDMGVSHSLSRHFFWNNSILWKEDLEERKVAVILSGEDQIVNTKEVWRYLTGQKSEEPSTAWKDVTVRV